jgi:pyridoxal/pyridoxine/pyridoxamine kinase
VVKIMHFTIKMNLITQDYLAALSYNPLSNQVDFLLTGYLGNEYYFMYE